MTQFLRDQASDSEEVVTPLMLDGTYLSRNSATLGPLTWQPPCINFMMAAGLMDGSFLAKGRLFPSLESIYESIPNLQPTFQEFIFEMNSWRVIELMDRMKKYDSAIHNW